MSQWLRAGGFSTVHLTDSKDFVVVRVFRMVGLLIFLKAKGCPFLVILKRRRGSVLEENSLFRIPAFGAFRMTLLFGSCRWGPASCFSLGTSPWKPACSPSFPVFFPRFCLPLFLCLVFLESFVAGLTSLFRFFCVRRLSSDVLHGRFRLEHMYRHRFYICSLPYDIPHPWSSCI